MVKRSPEGLLHPLGLKLLLVERPDEHEIGELADDFKRVGDATFPHLLPDGVYLSLCCSSNQLALLGHTPPLRSRSPAFCH